MKKILVKTLFSLGTLGVMLGGINSNLLNQPSKEANKHVHAIKQNHSPKSKKLVNRFYVMSEQEEGQSFNPDDAKYNSYWATSNEGVYDDYWSYVETSDLFVIKNIDYDGAYNMTFLWTHRPVFLSKLDYFTGTFNFDLYRKNQKISTKIIPFNSTQFNSELTLEKTISIDDSFDNLRFNYDLFAPNVASEDSPLTTQLNRDYVFSFAQYFNFSVDEVNFLAYNQAQDAFDFSLAISFLNNQLFIPEKNQLMLQVDGIKFELFANTTQREANLFTYRAFIPKAFFDQSNQVILIINNVVNKDVTGQVLPFIKNLDVPENSSYNNLNLYFYIGLTIGFIVLIILLVLMMLLIIKRRKQVNESNHFYEYKTYVDSNGEYIDFNQEEWNNLPKRKQKWFKEISDN